METEMNRYGSSGGRRQPVPENDDFAREFRRRNETRRAAVSRGAEETRTRSGETRRSSQAGVRTGEARRSSVGGVSGRSTRTLSRPAEAGRSNVSQVRRPRSERSEGERRRRSESAAVPERSAGRKRTSPEGRERSQRSRAKNPGLDRIMMGVKGFFLVFLVFYIIQVYGMGQAKDVPLSAIAERLEADTSVGDLTKRGVIDLKKNYGLSADDFEEFLLYSADSLMDVSEILIIKVRSSDQLPAAREAAERHIETEKEKFDGYGTNQYDLLEHAGVLEKGRYLYAAVSENEKQWEEVFLSCVD